VATDLLVVEAGKIVLTEPGEVFLQEDFVYSWATVFQDCKTGFHGGIIPRRCNGIKGSL
jgi:hypothetical protein